MSSSTIPIQPFITLLRRSGLTIPIDSAIIGQQIINLGYFSSTEKKLRQALKSVIIKRKEEFEIFDICFDIYFLNNPKKFTQKDIQNIINGSENKKEPTFSEFTEQDDHLAKQIGQEELINQYGDHRSDIASELQLNSQPGMIGGGISDGNQQNQNVIFYTRWLPTELQNIAFSFLTRPETAWDSTVEDFISLIFGYGQYNHVQTITQRYTRYASYFTRGFSQLFEEIKKDENFNSRIRNIEELEFLRERILSFLRKTRLILLSNPQLDSKDLLRQFYSLSYLPDVKDYLQQDFKRIEGDMEKVQRHLLYLGKKIAVQEKRKRIRAQCGKINFRRTIRKNISNGGHFISLSYQKKKRMDPKIILLSDVSGSTEWISEFFFIITYAAQSTFKKVLLFEFDNTTVEITKGLKSPTLSQALQKRIDSWQITPRTRQMHSNYNTALLDFELLAKKYFSKNTSVLLLGDCRDWMGAYKQNSKGDYEPESKNVLKKIIKKNKRLVILNPESPERWNTGDSIVQHFKDVGAQIYHVENILFLMNFIFKNDWYY